MPGSWPFFCAGRDHHHVWNDGYGGYGGYDGYVWFYDRLCDSDGCVWFCDCAGFYDGYDHPDCAGFCDSDGGYDGYVWICVRQLKHESVWNEFYEFFF